MEPSWWRRPSTLPLLLVVMALLIVVVGGSIRINDAGESCPEWPTCFGTYHFDVSDEEQAAYWENNPDQIDSRGPDHRYTTFQIFVEWFHRLLVGIIALPILLNVYTARKQTETYGSAVGIASIFSAALLFIQAAAGYVTVRFDNADWTVALHLSLACIFTAGLMWQYMSMRLSEGADWAFMQAPSAFLLKNRSRIHGMTAAVGLLLVLGAWVSSSAGGQYNQSCSFGFPNGWPKCQGSFFPSLDGPGVFIQMIHRFGALVVGLILILGISNLRTTTEGHLGSMALLRYAEVTTGLWMLNVIVGGSYIVFAKVGDFPEWLSLLHLVVGVTAFLSAVFVAFCTKFALNSTSFNPSKGEGLGSQSTVGEQE
jgi:cytochrome c oxidase assembly protein subunit 15